MLMSYNKIYAFKNTKVLNLLCSCIRVFLKIQTKLEVCIFVELLVEGVREYQGIVEILKDKISELSRTRILERFWEYTGRCFYLVF